MFSEGVNQSKKYEDDDVDMKTVDWFNDSNLSFIFSF
jgi:hypothetical protein